MNAGSGVRVRSGAGPAKWAGVVVLSVLTGAGATAWLLRGGEAAAPARGVEVVVPVPRAVEPAPVAAAPLAKIHKEAAPADPGAAASPVPVDTEAAGAVKGTLLNVNTATAAELELLPGIGPETARRIVAHRAKEGPFRTVEDLDKVEGIGPKTIEKIRLLIRVR